MSDFFATEQDQNQARLDAALAPPQSNSPSQPLFDGSELDALRKGAVGFFAGTGARVAEMAYGLTQYDERWAALQPDLQSDFRRATTRGYVQPDIVDTQEDWWERWTRQNAEDARRTANRLTYRPDPGTTSLASEILGGVVGPIAGAVGFGILPAASEFGRQQRETAIEQGVTNEATLRELELGTTVATAAAFAAPGALNGPLWSRILSGAAINAGAGAATRGLSAALLEQYPEVARQYQWLEPRALVTDALIGSVFGILHHPGGAIEGGAIPEGEPAPVEPLTPQQESDLRDLGAAALVERGALQEETAFGVPVNHASRQWQTEALERADEQIANDDPVDPGPVPDGVEFVPLPEDVARFEEDIRAFFTDSGLSPSEIDARMEALRGQGRERGIGDDEGRLYSMGARRRGDREDGGPLRSERLEVPEGVRLSPMAAKAAEMAHNGARNFWIAEELETTSESVNVLLHNARAAFESKGHQAPWERGSAGRDGLNTRTGEATAPIEELLQLRDHLSRQGYVNRRGQRPPGGKLSLNAEIARRLSVRYGRTFEPSNVTTRLFKYDAAVREGRREPAQYSVTELDAFSTPEELAARASRELGADWKALADAGFVELVARSRDVPAGMMGLPRGVQAVHFPGRRQTYFVASNIRPENLRGLILHEIGVHHGMEAMLGKRGFREVLRQVRGMLDAEHPDIVEAREYAERYAAKPDDVDEETLAYLIEAKSDLPLVQSLLSRLRQWLIKTFGSTFGMRLTVDDLRALALSSLRRVAEKARRESGGEFTVLGRDEAMASQSGRPAPPFYSGVERVVSEATTARASGSQWWATISKAPGVKREELQWIGVEDFLKAQEGQVSREDLLSFVRANGVQVEETVLGGEQNLERSQDVQRQLLPLIEEQTRLYNELSALKRPDMLDGDLPAETRARIAEIQARMRELDPEVSRLQDLGRSLRTADNTRWSQYVLPGGENYRELLLRLPEGLRAESRQRFDEISAEMQSIEDRQTSATWSNADFGRHRDLADERRRLLAQHFRTSHFSEPNILAHVRFNERTDAQGRRTLFLEEVQSDWHQGGRERGYKDAQTRAASERADQNLREAGDELDAAVEAGRAVLATHRSESFNEGSVRAVMDRLQEWRSTDPAAEQAWQRIAETNTRNVEVARQAREARNDSAVPDAPFKNNAWAALSLKRMIRWAAENGFDQIAWTRGQHQIERFNLANHIDALRYQRNGDGTFSLETIKEGRRADIPVPSRIKPSELDEIVGREIADKIRASQGEEIQPDRHDIAFEKRGAPVEAFERNGKWYIRYQSGEEMGTWLSRADAEKDMANQQEMLDRPRARLLSGVDLQVGGEGMRAFYDRILPNIANDLGKKYGARVGETEIDAPENPGRNYFVRERGNSGRWEIVDKRTDKVVTDRTFSSGSASEQWLRDQGLVANTETVHSLPITPEMRAQALEGQPLFSMGAGKNRGNVLRDPIESRSFQDRLKAVEDRLHADGVLGRTALGKTREDGAGVPGRTGRIERLGSEGDASGTGARRSDGEASARIARLPREVVDDILSVSGLKLEKKGGLLGEYRASIDLPHQLDPEIETAIAAQGERNDTQIRFDLIERGGGTRMMLRWTQTHPGVRGAKAGRWLYRHLIDWALEQGYEVYSDFSVSPSAQRIYESLQRSGYRVERDPRAIVDEEDGALVNPSLEPVYRVYGGESAEIIPAAPPPRGGYEIDGPTLKERMQPLVDAQKRQDAYDALSPAEQAIADNPEMKFSVGPPRKPERRRVNLPHPFIGAADVIIRPTQRHLEAMLKEQHQRDVQSIRWGITASGELVAWDGMQAMHGSVGESLGGRFVETGEIEHALEIDPVFAALERVRNEEGARDPSRVADTLGITPATAKRMLARDGMLTARDMMDILKQEKAEAAEMRKGFEAAARCAARHGAQQAGHILIPLSTGSAVTDAWMGQVLGMGAAIPLGVTATPYLAQASRSANPNSPLARARLENMAADAAGASHRLGQAAGLDNPSGFDAGEGASFSDQTATDAELPSLDEGPPLPPEGYVKPGQAVPEDAP